MYLTNESAGALRKQPPAWPNDIGGHSTMSTVQIPLSSRKYPGLIAIIDEEDFPRVSTRIWRPSFHPSIPNHRRRCVVVTRGKGASEPKNISLHRFILQAPPGTFIDHINGDTLDCRRENLRFVTEQQNSANARLPMNNTSGYKGVSFEKREGKYRAGIGAHGKKYKLGWFDDPIAAAHAYDDAAREHFGKFARLNFPRDGEQSAIAAAQEQP